MLFWSLWDKMKRDIFKSKRLYIANLTFVGILFMLTTLSLYSLFFVLGYDTKEDNEMAEKALYWTYFSFYAVGLILLLVKPLKAIRYLNIVYCLAIILNLIDYAIHYSKYEQSIAKYFFIFIVVSFTIIFLTLLYFNNRKIRDLSFSELDEIGKAE